jgi:hypothetical protein
MPTPTIYTWFIAIFGFITFSPLFIAQFFILINPHAQKTKDLLIGKGEDWRDKTHFKSAYAFAWADWLVLMPLIVTGTSGVLFSQPWGYIIWIVAGVISIYFSIIFWFLEKEYTYPSYGPLAYYTYYWGFFLYWGIAATVYSFYQILS